MEYLAAILPSVGVLFLFVVAIRAIFQADRRERLAQAQWERRERAADRKSGGTTTESLPPVTGEPGPP